MLLRLFLGLFALLTLAACVTENAGSLNSGPPNTASGTADEMADGLSVLAPKGMVFADERKGPNETTLIFLKAGETNANWTERVEVSTFFQGRFADTNAALKYLSRYDYDTCYGWSVINVLQADLPYQDPNMWWIKSCDTFRPDRLQEGEFGLESRFVAHRIQRSGDKVMAYTFMWQDAERSGNWPLSSKYFNTNIFPVMAGINIRN